MLIPRNWRWLDMNTEHRPDKPGGSAATEETPEAQRERTDAQEAQLEAQQRGDTAEELRQFAKEVMSDQKQFPSDIAEDARDPQRREDERQGTPPRPGHEPGD